jgi:ABC-type glycerol-3-phosphate transport system permease component
VSSTDATFGHTARLSRAFARYALLIGASIAAIYPVLWVATVAMKTQPEFAQDPMGLPDAFDLSNFSAILGDEGMRKYFLNSLLVVGITVPVATATCVAAGYALARLWGRGGVVILLVFLFSELVPLSIVIIPLFVTVKELGIDNGILRLMCVYSVGVMGFAVLVSRAFFRSIPEELREAARLDGCTEFQVFRRIMVPLARSPIALIAIVSFLFLWNEFFLAAVLVNSPDERTIPLGLVELRGQYTSDWPKLAAALLLSMVPTLVLYGLFQKRITGQFSRSTTRE